MHYKKKRLRYEVSLMLKVRIDLNKSPSTSTLNCPFCNSVKLLTIAKPNPEPLVFLDLSP